KNYFSLSREMEFHADTVAASVAGSNNLVSALKRIEMGSACYNITLQKCNEIYKEKQVSKNIYINQTVVLTEVAKEFEMPVKDGLPVVSDAYLRGQNLSRINFKDQWASHPTTEEREIRLNKLGVHSEPDAQLAWAIFRNSPDWQEKLTKQ